MHSMRVKVYNNLGDPELITAWTDAQNAYPTFPMMQIEWITPWWSRNSTNRNLNVYVLYDGEDQASCVAPFCVQKEFGIKVLRSIPIHFGDFYHFISKDDESEHFMIEYLKKDISASVVHIFNCNNQSTTFKSLVANNFQSREIVKILAPNFEGLEFNDFLLEISKNSRGQFRKKRNRLIKKGSLKLKEIRKFEDYMTFFPETKRLYNIRWKEDKRPLLSDEYYTMRNTSLEKLFDQGKAVLFLVQWEGKTVAFRLGFLDENCFYDWKTAHDPEFDYYSPGFLSVGLIIERLIEKGYSRFNFMTGNYQYKRSWSNLDEENYNAEFFKANNAIGKMYVNYRLNWREKIKAVATKLKLR